MAPHLGVTTITSLEEETPRIAEESTTATTGYSKTVVLKGYKGVFGEYKTELKWLHIIPMGLFHLVCLYTILFFPYLQNLQKVLTFAWMWAMCGFAGFGITGGAHRYWCHRSYKARMPLQILLMICFSTAGQNNIYDWVRDHRVHHKFSETSADPHDSNRGFFFSHIGWLFLRKHPDVIRRGKELDMSDIVEDPVVKFHTKFFQIFRVVFCFVLPPLVPIYCWGEEPKWAFLSQICMRYLITLHSTWSVNSAAHLFGYKPYDTKINPRENKFVSVFAMGEGWHNFHHTFPWDYRASEFANTNLTLAVLNFFAKIGWAYDMKKASDKLVKMVVERRGPEASHHHHHHHHPQEVPESEAEVSHAKAT